MEADGRMLATAWNPIRPIMPRPSLNCAVRVEPCGLWGVVVAFGRLGRRFGRPQ